MEWLQYLLFGVVLFLVIQRLLPTKGLTDLSAEEVFQKLKNPKDHVFLDVREAHEYREGHIKGFKNIPLSQLASRQHEIDRNKSIILTCRSGMRSRQAAKILRRNGFSRISHLKNGVLGWHTGLNK
ncbi:rhodanese-like domain-containing protein [Effusibacillus consociatus]|uniref:Rhodanese-like domain-containing protein n=1 Tax=Effusibacillus consociatus TaxID=1117041 RepID=A0ABV9PYS2_9BACL